MLLVSCYSMGHQPLVLATAQATLKAAGVPVSLVDTSLEVLDPASLRAHDCLAIAVPMHTALRLGAQVCRTARAQGFDGVICFFGLYAPLHRDHLFSCGADVVLGPDALDGLVAVAHQAPHGRVRAVAALHGVDGVGLLDQDAALPPPRPAATLPDRSGMHALAQYTALQVDGARTTVGYVETTHGCKHTCRHCPITPVYQGRFYAVDRDVVLRDVDALVALGARHITFGDPDFLNGPSHALRITQALAQRHPGVTWDATIKVEHLLAHAALLPVFKQRGCLFIVTAAESLSNVVLGHLHKGHTAADLDRALELVTQAGITLRPTFVSFTPWTTAQDLLDMCDWVDAHGLHGAVDPVQLAVRLLIPPGSALLVDHAHAPWMGPLDAAALTYRWTHPDPRMDALGRELGDLAAQAATAGNPPPQTLVDLMDVVRARLHAPRARHQPSGRAAPRLTEHWFC